MVASWQTGSRAFRDHAKRKDKASLWKEQVLLQLALVVFHHLSISERPDQGDLQLFVQRTNETVAIVKTRLFKITIPFQSPSATTFICSVH